MNVGRPRNPSSETRVLVTGATGLIGSHLVHSLDGAVDLHLLTRSVPAADSPGTTWWTGDIAEPGVLRNIIEETRPDAVCHLAGLVNGGRSLDLLMPTLQANLVATVELLEATTRIGCSRVVLAGSLMEEPDDRVGGTPGSPYGASRAAASSYSRMCHALFGTPAVVLRPSYVYGPQQSDISKLVPHVISCFLDDVSPQLTSGHRNIDWLYADDAADAFRRALFAPGIEGATIDLESGQRHSVRDVVMQLHQIVEPPHAVPRFGSAPTRPFEQDVVADAAPANRLLGWTADTRLSDGLAETVEWHRSKRERPAT